MTRRRIAGIVALVFLGCGVGLQWWPGAAASYEGISAACIRIGAMLAVVWLALPEVGRRQGRWLVLGLAIAAAVVVLVPRLIALAPRLIPLALLVLALIAILRPRMPRSPMARG